MKVRRYLYGAMGLLSLLGFIGLFTDEKEFLIFFLFVVDFEYFFMKSDEMFEEYMNKSASRAFYCGMIMTTISVLINFYILKQPGHAALSIGIAIGWGVSVGVYALSTAFYGFKETWGLHND